MTKNKPVSRLCGILFNFDVSNSRACGTGATASAMAAILRGFTDDEVRVSLRGGDLLIHFDRESRHLFMTGPAKEVFHGSIDIPEEIYYDLSEK